MQETNRKRIDVKEKRGQERARKEERKQKETGEAE